MWAATCWVAENAGRFSADGSRLAVAGDSAGGTLAAVVARRARDRVRAGAGPAVVFQLLWYPSTMWDTSLPSFSENAEAPVLDHAAIAAFTRWYAGHLDPSDPPADLAPGRATDLTGLAPAYIAVAGHDPLRDDGARYAELLAQAGVQGNCTTPRPWYTATWATPGWCRPQPRPPTAVWRPCGRPCTGAGTSNVCRPGYDKPQ